MPSVASITVVTPVRVSPEERNSTVVAPVEASIDWGGVHGFDRNHGRGRDVGRPRVDPAENGFFIVVPDVLENDRQDPCREGSADFSTRRDIRIKGSPARVPISMRRAIPSVFHDHHGI